MTIFTLQSSGPPVRVVYGGDGATLIVNRDLVNQVIYGDQSIVGDNSNSYSIIDPLGSITVDGQSDVYALGLSGNPTINVTNGAASWTPSPAQIAAQINALGIPEATAAFIATGNINGLPGGAPLLRQTENLAFVSAGNNSIVPANGGIVTLVNASSINQPGFEFTGQVFMGLNAGTIPFVRLTISWLDSVSGLTTSFKHYYLTCGNGIGNFLTFYLNGPCLGDQVNVFVTGLDPAVTAVMQWTFNITSHVFQHDQLFQTSFGTIAPNSFTNPGGDPAAGILALSQPTVNPSTNIFRLAAIHSGPATLAVDNTSTTNPIVVGLQDPSTLYSSTPNIRMGMLRLTASSSGLLNVILPYGPVLIQITNAGSTNTVSPHVALLSSDQ